MFSETGSSVRRAVIRLLGGLAIGLPLLPAPMAARSEALPSGLSCAFLALNAAPPGGVITLQAVATFTGPGTRPTRLERGRQGRR